MKISVFEDNRFFDRMEQEAEPGLAACRLPGRKYQTPRNETLAYEAYLSPKPKGIIVISHGFVESAEKFREMAWYFLQAGYHVFALDHRGHGRSVRQVPELWLTHVERFEDYVIDFVDFVRNVVIPVDPALPRYLYAHSMGGAIGARILQTTPDLFQKAVLTAPMIAAKTQGYPRTAARLIAACACRMGKGKKAIFAGLGGYFPEKETFEASPDTCRERFLYYHRKRIAQPQLQNANPSYRWLLESLKITSVLLNPASCRQVTAPVLLFQAEEDTFVRSQEQQKWIAAVPKGQLILVLGSKHEIYASPAAVLQPYLDQILTFLEKA